jgi:TrmH family RNA methyltransferase
MLHTGKTGLFCMITKKIESLQHPIVKHLVKLRENRAWREETKRVLIFGKKMVREVAQVTSLHTLLVSSDDLDLKGLHAETLIYTSTAVMKKITGLVEPEGLAAEVTLPASQDLSGKNYLLVLDKISDPGNMGTLLRSALGLGWDGAIILDGSVDPFHEKAIRASMGASFFLPLAFFSEEALCSFLLDKGYHGYLADMQAEAFSTTDFVLPLALFLSSESQGFSPFAEKLCRKISIPMKQQVDSLNVAVAGGILMYGLKKP